MEDNLGKPPHNVLFIIDEFYCLGRSEAIDRAMGLMRGYGLTLWPIIQHMGQLRKHYGDTADNFLRNCRAVQYFGDQEPATLQEIEKRIGERIVRDRDGRETRYPFIAYSDLATRYFRRDSGRQMVMFQQQAAAPLALTHYYKHPWLFPRNTYDVDPRQAIRSQYSALTRP